MAVVTMPDGQDVDFGDMPDDQIRGMIQQKFPDHVAQHQQGQDLLDVGPPALNIGQDIFNPGFEGPNKAAQAVSESVGKAASNLPGSAGNVASNIGSAIWNFPETATNVGHLVAGVGQYLGVPGDSYEKYADAAGRAIMDRYGSFEKAKNTFETDPVGFAMDISSVLGMGRLAARMSAPARIAAPTTADIFEAANNGYANARGYGVEIHPQAVVDLAEDIRRELHNDGFRPANQPQTFGALDELANPTTPTVDISDIDSVRKVLNRAGANFTESASSRRAIGAIDDFMATLDPADVVNNPHYARAVGQEIATARANYAAASHARQIENATNAAELQAASTGSGANINNALRQKFRAILTSPTQRRGYNPQQLDAMQQLVEGTDADNAMRLLGKLAPSGIVSGAGTALLGEAIGHKFLPGMAGFAAKKIADMRTASRAAQLSEQARLRSPLAQQMGATPAPRLNLPRTATSLARKLNLLGRLPGEI
jgi:hypothetical protein